MKKLCQLIDFLGCRYGIKVIVVPSDVVRIAKVSKDTILLNGRSRAERELLFITAHLFGHLVQTSGKCPEEIWGKFKNLRSLQLFEEYRRAVWEFEIEAYQIGKGLLQEVFGIEEVSLWDEKYQIYIDTDLTTFWCYLKTGNQISIPDFNLLLEQNYVRFGGMYSEPLVSKPLPSFMQLSGFATTVY